MPGLTPAHRGYEYQDLMTACRLVDVVLGEKQTVLVDEKLFTGDRFDDLTIYGPSGRERTQFKHTDADDRALTLATFTGDQRDLRLDKLVLAAAADKAGPGAGSAEVTYRIVLRDAHPTDNELTAVLHAADPDPGPYQAGMATSRLRFDADTLWEVAGRARDRFAFLREGDDSVTKDDLKWFCERAVVEVEAPRASWDLTEPGPAEALLLERLRADVGAGAYPNHHRSALDVADAFIRTARLARQGSVTISREEILRRAQLRQDFGAVTPASPADPWVAVERNAAVSAVAKAASETATSGGAVIVTAPPGHGKSWLCDQLTTQLNDAGWLVAEHYCYLGDADDERDARVVGDSLYGSLLARIADADPAAVAQQRPLLAATDEAVVAAVATAITCDPTRRVALVVDGLDHVTRVRNNGAGFDASRVMAESLAALELPPNSTLIVLSQPGSHLQPLLDIADQATQSDADDAANHGGVTSIGVPGLTRSELAKLAGALGMPNDPEDPAAREFLDALEERAGGNALYATYLCREVMREPSRSEHAAASVRSMPAFDGTLASYYQHLWRSLEQQTWWVAEVIGVVDFAVSRDELRAINPAYGHRVNAALDALAPVLVEQPGQDRVRIYHESFGRFLRERLQGDPDAMTAILGSVATWLQGLGMFEDTRAFRSLIPVLARAGRHEEAAVMIDHDFVVNAVAAALPTSAIRACLAAAASSAVHSRDWAAMIRCIELGRAAETLQDERFESSIVQFADVVVSLVGADSVADRLLHEGRPVMSGRSGLQMCAAVDRLGGVPPWREYMSAFKAAADLDRTSYGEASDSRAALSWLHGRLRLSSSSGGPPPTPRTFEDPGPSSPQDDLSGPIRWDVVAEHLDDDKLSPSAVIELLANTYGDDAVEQLAALLQEPGAFCLSVAEAVAAGRIKSTRAARSWADSAVEHGLPVGALTRLVALGLAPNAEELGATYDRDVLLRTTREVQQTSVHREDDVLPTWLDDVAAAAHVDPIGTNAAEALLEGPGWYLCWLRFCIALARVEALEAPTTQDRDVALEAAVSLLTDDVRPFVGSPRACDLYAIHPTVQARVRRAVSMVTDDDVWERIVGVIREVGSDIATTLSGELGGPLPSDWLLQLMIETAPPSKSDAVREMAKAQAADSNAQFYSDIADETLFAARTELDAGDHAAARDLWRSACQLLVAYGWRKDPTIYELLDPFPMLTTADPQRARERLPALQGICERVWLHTDGKGTRQAPARWWTLLATADPVALADLVAPAVHRRSNEPAEHLHDALTELWRAWCAEADPVVLGALRLAMNAPLDPSDAKAFARLAQEAPNPACTAGHLLTSTLARLDERPPRYPVTNTDEMIASDEVNVTAVNLAVRSANAPTVHPLPNLASAPDHGQRYDRPTPSSPDDPAGHLGAMVLPTFPPGPAGTARAVRAWQARPYSDTSEAWTVDRAALVLGFRLLELAQNGRSEEAVTHLKHIADGSGFGRDSDLLSALADGFALRGEKRLAAVAGALAWTRARGSGGWLAFGGETHLDALRIATDADAGTVLDVVGEEISRTVRSDRVETGVTQALIIAFATGALRLEQPEHQNSVTQAGTDAAFMCFDAAMEVIGARTPRMQDHDDPDLPYAPPSSDVNERAPGDLDAAIATAVIAFLARPEREAKRRALLATEYLLTHRPEATANGLHHALASQSDPGSLTWLLSLLTQTVDPGSPALAASADTLAALAAGPHLVVRVLARTLCATPPALPAPDLADLELVDENVPRLWIPGAEGHAMADDERFIRAILGDFAGERLEGAEPILPGLIAATLRRLSIALDDDDLQRKMRRQLDQLGDSDAEENWPDTWLAIAEAAEESVQRAAAGVRLADPRRGVLSEPGAREAKLAEALLGHPSLAITLEATRQPRPPVPVPPSRYDPMWESLFPLLDASGGVAPDDSMDRSGDGRGETSTSRGAQYRGAESCYATVVTSVLTDFTQLTDAGSGWRVLASIERLRSSASRMAKEQDVIVSRFRGPEIRADGDREGFEHPPFVSGALEQWGWAMEFPAPFRSVEPLSGMDTRVGEGTDTRMGLGLPKIVITPSLPLIAILRATQASRLYELGDDDGPLAALRTWRCLYDTSDYHQSWPRLEGTALVVTERAFDRLSAAVTRLTLRDFIGRNDAP